MAEPVACVCCRQWCVPEAFEARPDPQYPGHWRVVEVGGAPDAPHVVAHASGVCCERHARRLCAVLREQRGKVLRETLTQLAHAYDGACGVVTPAPRGVEDIALRD